MCAGLVAYPDVAPEPAAWEKALHPITKSTCEFGPAELLTVLVAGEPSAAEMQRHRDADVAQFQALASMSTRDATEPLSAWVQPLRCPLVGQTSPLSKAPTV